MCMCVCHTDYCLTTALLLLYYCDTTTLLLMYDYHINYYFTTVLLLLYYCVATTLLLRYYYFTTVVRLLWQWSRVGVHRHHSSGMPIITSIGSNVHDMDTSTYRRCMRVYAFMHVCITHAHTHTHTHMCWRCSSPCLAASALRLCLFVTPACIT